MLKPRALLQGTRGAGLGPSSVHLVPCRPAQAPFRCSRRRHETSRQRSLLPPAATGNDGASQRHQLESVQQHQHPASPQWTSHVSRRMNLELAVEDAVNSALEAAQHSGAGAGSSSPTLALVFVSSAFAEEYNKIVGLIRGRLPSVNKIFGSSGFGVIGGCGTSSEEIENVPAISITLASLPGTDIHLSHVAMHNLPSADAPPGAWRSLLGLPPALSPMDSPNDKPLSLVVIADVSFLRLQELLAGLDYALPGASIIGGLSSAGMMTPDRGLFCFDAAHVNADPATQHGVYQTGVVVMALHGGVTMELMVAQGCRPLCGTTWAVEAVDHGRNMITAVSEESASTSGGGGGGGGGSCRARLLTPLEALQRDLIGQSGKEDQLRRLLQNLVVGLAPDPLLEVAEAADFLVRPMGFARQEGYMEVGDPVRVGQRLRFMVRDVNGAMEDLQRHGTAFKRRQLEELLSGSPRPQPLGMMIFSCSGRGTNLYPQPSYDTRTVSAFVPVPAAGFLCNGEIGSVHGVAQLHGFACVVGVLRGAEGAGAEEGASPGSSGEGEGASKSRHGSGSSGPDP